MNFLTPCFVKYFKSDRGTLPPLDIQTDRYIRGSLDHVKYEKSIMTSCSEDLSEEIQRISEKITKIVSKSRSRGDKLSPSEGRQLALIAAAKRRLVATLALRDGLMVNYAGELVSWDQANENTIYSDFQKMKFTL